MNLVIDAAGDVEQAACKLQEHGAKRFEVVPRAHLKPQALLGTLRRWRKVRPGTCYVFCREHRSQFNQFPLKLIALLCRARRIQFCDGKDMGLAESWARVIFRGFPLYLFHWTYGLIAALAFWAVFALLWLVVKSRGPVVPGRMAARELCYIKTYFWQGSAGGSVTHTREFLNAGHSLGGRIRIFATDPLTDYQLRDRVEVIEPSRALYDLPSLFSELEYNLRFTLRVWRQLAGREPGWLYQRNSPNSLAGVLLSMVLRRPFVLEFNTPLAWAQKNWHGARRAYSTQCCESLNLAGACRVAVVSELLKQHLMERGVPEAKIVVNPNGVDPQRFRPQADTAGIRERIAQGKLLVGFIGIFSQWHGVLTLMKCVKHVIREFPEAHFVIIGDGALKSSMLEILARDGSKPYVTFTGVVPHDRAPAFLNACDILVSPHEDMADGTLFFGSPTKVFEYMAAGKGLVVSSVGQLRSLLENEKDALLVQQRDEQGLARAIVRLLRDAPLRERLGQAARQKVIANYTWTHNFMRAVPQDGSLTGEPGVAQAKDMAGAEVLMR